MIEFIERLNQDLESWSLLKHPFYQAWNEGTLSHDTLKFYAQEYFHHVAAFPRYISRIHSQCDNLKDRQILLENLREEEEGDNNHPELWMRFIEGLCHTRLHPQHPRLESTKKLVCDFFKLTDANYATGLGALYAYERQTPSVSESKIRGLKKHYHLNDPRALEFFVVHQAADQWHTEALCTLIKGLNSTEQDQVYCGALSGAQSLWQFLDGIYTDPVCPVSMN